MSGLDTSQAVTVEAVELAEEHADAARAAQDAHQAQGAVPSSIDGELTEEAFEETNVDASSE